MQLLPREQEKMMVYLAAQIARDRKERGVKLNHPEAVALIAAALLEDAREGKSVSEAMSHGAEVLSSEDVMDGVPEMVEQVQVEATFPTGTHLITVRSPIS